MLTAQEIVQQQSSASLSALALKVFFNIADEWRLSPLQQRILLGRPTETTYARWYEHSGPPLPHDTLERISYLMDIYQMLRQQLPNANLSRAWLYCPNSQFTGHSALEVMLKGNMADLIRVKQHLE